MQAHEYSIIGHSRASIGRYLGAVAAIVASTVTAVTAGLSNLLTGYGWPNWTLALLTIPITGGIAYAGAHWVFDKFAWRMLSFFSQIPHIDGIWQCNGKTLNEKGETTFDWNGKVTISQNWEKIRVRLATGNSASNSVSAALIPEPDGCWTLMYSYRNEPRIGEVELNAHIGYCELRFAKNTNEAAGDYFNAKGRGTFGRMELKREGSK